MLRLWNLIRRAFQPKKKVDGHLFRVTVVGATSPVGELVCLQLKQSRFVKSLVLSDTETTVCSVCNDLHRIDTRTTVDGYFGKAGLPSALKNADIVVVCEPGKEMNLKDENERFLRNADQIYDTSKQLAKVNPHAILAIQTEPVESMVPLACEVLRNNEVLEPFRILGITGENVIRATTIIARELGGDPCDFIVPVYGGKDSKCSIPFFSQMKPNIELPEEQLQEVRRRILGMEKKITENSNNEKASAMTTSLAVARFVNTLSRGLRGEEGMVECAFVPTKKIPGLNYYTMPVNLGRTGVMTVYPPTGMNKVEEELLTNTINNIKQLINKGEEYARTRLSRQDDENFPVKERSGRAQLSGKPVAR